MKSKWWSYFGWIIMVIAIIITVNEWNKTLAAMEELGTAIVVNQAEWKAAYDKNDTAWKTAYDKVVTNREEWMTAYDKVVAKNAEWKTAYDKVVAQNAEWKTTYDNLKMQNDWYRKVLIETYGWNP